MKQLLPVKKFRKKPRTQIPKYIRDYGKHLRTKHHLTYNSVRATMFRLLVIHRALVASSQFKHNHNGQWAEVKKCPIPYAGFEDWDQFFIGQYKKKSANTRRAYKQAINRFMAYAITRLGYTNPMTELEWQEISIGRKNYKDRTKKVIVLDDKKVSRLIKQGYRLDLNYENICHVLIMRVLAETGGRISEVLKIAKRDLKHPNGTPAIRLENRKTIQQRYKERIVPISESLYEALQNFLKLKDNEGIGSSRVFSRRDGEPVSYSAIAHYLGKFGVRAHLFRHYRLTKWVQEMGINQASKVAYFAGDEIRTILNTYYHHAV